VLSGGGCVAGGVVFVGDAVVRPMLWMLYEVYTGPDVGDEGQLVGIGV